MKIVKPGRTSLTIAVFVPSTASTTGAGLTGVAYNASNFVASYWRTSAASRQSITLADMTLGTWASGGWKEIDATNMPGYYAFGVPNAALATGADSVVLGFRGAANMPPVSVAIDLSAEVKLTPDGLSALQTGYSSGTFAGLNFQERLWMATAAWLNKRRDTGSAVEVFDDAGNTAIYQTTYTIAGNAQTFNAPTIV